MQLRDNANVNLVDVEIVNKVANSGLIELDLSKMTEKEAIMELDIKDVLYQGLLLKEKEFRNHVKETDWSGYRNKNVAVWCSTEAIVPTWAYMLLATALTPIAKSLIYGKVDQLKERVLEEEINKLSLEEYTDKRVVIKGCGDEEVSVNAYVQLTSRLLPVAKSIMYGEPCSTVPLYKRK